MESVTELVFSKASGFYYTCQCHSFGWSVFLEKLEAFLINMKTLLMAVTNSALQSVFGEVSGLYTRNVSQRVCDRIWF